MGTHRKGFTLIEIMIVVSIIGLIAVIAVPNYYNARRKAIKNTCDANRISIEKAVQLWALETNASAADTPEIANIVPDYLRSWPKCGTIDYAVPSVSSTVSCPNPACPNYIPSEGGGGEEIPPVYPW